MSGERLHHFVADLVIAPDGLDVVVIIERAAAADGGVALFGRGARLSGAPDGPALRVPGAAAPPCRTAAPISELPAMRIPHAAPRTLSPIAAATPADAKKYGSTFSNRNARYLQSIIPPLPVDPSPSPRGATVEVQDGAGSDTEASDQVVVMVRHRHTRTVDVDLYVVEWQCVGRQSKIQADEEGKGCLSVRSDGRGRADDGKDAWQAD